MKTIATLFYLFLLLSIAAVCQAETARGKVLDANHKPIAGADILMRFKLKDNNEWKYQQTKTSAKGLFVVQLPDNVAFSSEYYPPIIYAVAPGKVYSVAYLQPQNNVLYLDDAQILRGRVVDQQDEPVVNAKVRLRSTDGKNRPLSVYLPEETPWKNRFQTITDENGHWEMRVAPPGEDVNLIVSAPRFRPVNFTIFTGMKPVTIHLHPGVIISGRVVDEKRKPLGGVALYMKENRQTVTTNNKGAFRLTGLNPQTYHISINAGERPIVAQDIEVTITEKDGVKKLPDIVMTPGGLVVGMVMNERTGEPISGAAVSCSSAPRSGVLIRLITVRTDANGKYQLRLPPGKRLVFASNRDEKYFEQTYFHLLDVKANQSLIQDFQIDPGLTLSGTAVDGRGKALQGVAVYVDAMPDKDDYKVLSRQAVTDKNGHWSISGIAPRQVQVRVGKPWATRKPVTFSLPHSEKVQLHLIHQSTLPPLGRLVDRDGKPLAGIKVTLQYQMPHPTPFDIKTTMELFTDMQGYYHFRVPLIASQLEIAEVNAPHYEWASGGEWDEKTRQFSDAIFDPLTRRIQGHVLNPDGSPSAETRVVALSEEKQETVTDSTGKFQFTHLPHSPLTLLAIGDTGVAKREVISNNNLSLQLHPLKNHFPTQEYSHKALDKLPHPATEESFAPAPFLHSLAIDASKLPPQKALEIYRETFARENTLSLGDAAQPRMAGLIYDADAGQGKVLFDHLLQKYFSATSPLMKNDTAQLAYYLARYQPQTSWELLQTDWANKNFSVFVQSGLTLAMSAVDFEEALNWARHITGRTSPGESLADIREATRRKLYQIALATPEDRRNLCLDCLLFAD